MKSLDNYDSWLFTTKFNHFLESLIILQESISCINSRSLSSHYIVTLVNNKEQYDKEVSAFKTG